MNELDKFESMIKGRLQEHEAPFDAGAWDAMDQKLTRHARVQTYKKVGWVGAAAIGTGLIIGGIYAHKFIRKCTNKLQKIALLYLKTVRISLYMYSVRCRRLMYIVCQRCYYRIYDVFCNHNIHNICTYS